MDLVHEYFWATECNLATLHDLLMLGSASKKRINRQKQICVRMLGVCHREITDMTREHQYDYDYLHLFSINHLGQTPRLKKIIIDMNNDRRFFDESMLERWVHIVITEWNKPDRDPAIINA